MRNREEAERLTMLIQTGAISQTGVLYNMDTDSGQYSKGRHSGE